MGPNECETTKLENCVADTFSSTFHVSIVWNFTQLLEIFHSTLRKNIPHRLFIQEWYYFFNLHSITIFIVLTCSSSHISKKCGVSVAPVIHWLDLMVPTPPGSINYIHSQTPRLLFKKKLFSSNNPFLFISSCFRRLFQLSSFIVIHVSLW